MRVLAALSLVLWLSPAFAAEIATLRSGFRIRAAHHETIGDRIRLVSEDGGLIELPARAVVGFEPLETAPSPEPRAVREEPRSVDEIVADLARRLDVHPALVHSVIAAESAYDAAAVSRKGAIGLMQLMPETARELKVDPRDPEQNLAGGVRYLKSLFERYAGSRDQLVKALAAYNAGPGAVDRHGGAPPYSETHAFVRRVLKRFLELTDPPPR